VVLTARVHTVAQTQAGTLTDDFIQTCNVNLGSSIIEWRRPFTQSRKGYWEGLIYEHQGSFGYSAKLKPNMLFGPITVDSEIAAVPPAAELSSAESYPADTTETIEGTFACWLDSDQPVSRVENEVEVGALLTGPEGNKVFFGLVSQTLPGENITVSFPLDIDLFYDIITAAEEASGKLASYQLDIQAEVHTVAQSEFGVIDELLSPRLIATMDSDYIKWPEATEETKSDSITETVVVLNRDRGAAIMGSLGALGMTTIALLYTVWRYWESRHRRIPVLVAEAMRAMRKHKDTIVDVRNIPPAQMGQVVVPLDSLDELVKTADALLKPVLHQAEPRKHTYCVIDAMIRYEYISEF